MAVSTHRWRPEIGVKSGYTRKSRKFRYSKENTKCLIELKFEKSSYFFGVKNPITAIYKLSSVSSSSFNKLQSKSHFSENSVLASFERKLTKKLYVSEYVESKNIASLTKLNDNFVRGYILSADKAFLDEAIAILELIKIKFTEETWHSYRLIIVPKTSDMSTEVLRNNVDKPVVSTLKMRIQQVDVDEFDEDIEYDDEITDDEISRSTTTTLDEDAEEKLRNKAAYSKFRDSRIILANRPKTLKPEIDPVEKCFVALTKMFEDNIFSAAKGLTELNLEISNMMKSTSHESLEKNSTDSMDINFLMK